jgi:hypothetical protein
VICHSWRAGSLRDSTILIGQAQTFAGMRVSAKRRLQSLACRYFPRNRALAGDRVLY